MLTASDSVAALIASRRLAAAADARRLASALRHPRDADLPGAPTTRSSSTSLINNLEHVALKCLESRLAKMFDGADDLLFDMAKGATNNNEQRNLFDAMRIIRLERLKIAKTFLGKISAGFIPTDPRIVAGKPSQVSYETLGLQEVQTLERTIAVSNMAAKAQGLYQSLIWEIETRLESYFLNNGLMISPHVLSPMVICEAFQSSTEVMDCEFAVGLVVYKLFDRVVVGDLAGMYTDILSFLKAQGVKADPRLVAPRPNASETDSADTSGADASAFQPEPAFEEAAQYAPAGSGAQSPQIADPQQRNEFQERSVLEPSPRRDRQYQSPKLDLQTRAILSRIEAQIESRYDHGKALSGQQKDVTAQRADSRLARDLAAVALGKIVPGWNENQAMAYIQRAGAVGEMFNQILADPNIPTTLKPQFDDLRFVVIKNALKDVSFFANPKHPVRGLLNELSELAATARVAGPEMLGRVRELVGQIQNQFDVAAESVRTPGVKPEPLEDTQIANFLKLQAEQNAARRQALLTRARRVVAEELQLRTAGRIIPKPARDLLNSGWGPMQGMRLLRHGGGSLAWNEGLALLDRIIETVDPQSAECRAPAYRESLAEDLRSAFEDVGMSESRINALVNRLPEIFRTIDAQVGEAPIETEAYDPGLDRNSPRALKLLVNAALSPTTAAPERAIDESAIIDLLIVPGAWFHVFDHRTRDYRWLKAIAYYSIRDTVAFAEFNGRNTLYVKSKLFFSDLAEGRIRPLDLSPMSRRAVDVFLSAKTTSTPAPLPGYTTVPSAAAA